MEGLGVCDDELTFGLPGNDPWRGSVSQSLDYPHAVELGCSDERSMQLKEPESFFDDYGKFRDQILEVLARAPGVVGM